VGRSGSVLAFERSASRLETLERRVKENGAGGIIATRGADFTEANPNGDMFGGVTHVLIDPSCSGSGIVGFQESGAGEWRGRRGRSSIPGWGFDDDI
jgi:putative methyltransferase